MIVFPTVEKPARRRRGWQAPACPARKVAPSAPAQEAVPRRISSDPESGLPEAVTLAVQRFQAGEDRETSFRVLFDYYHPTVERFFARRAGSLEESLDLSQETFLRVYKGLDGFKWQAPLGAWIFRIAWNVLHSSCTRARATWPWGQQVELLDPGPERAAADSAGGAGSTPQPGPSRLIEQEKKDLLRRAIARLPARRRRCVILWAYHQLTYRQIAATLRISIGTVKAHMSQARQQLESSLVAVNPGEAEDD